MKLDLEKVAEMIRTETDPEKLGRDLKAIVEEVHPVAVFKAGEIIPLHEFLARFKKTYCGNIEPTFFQWPVRVFYDTDGGLMIQITQPTCPELSRRIDLTEVEE